MQRSAVQRLADGYGANVNFAAAARRYGLLTTNGDVTTSFFVAYAREEAGPVREGGTLKSLKGDYANGHLYRNVKYAATRGLTGDHPGEYFARVASNRNQRLQNVPCK